MFLEERNYSDLVPHSAHASLSNTWGNTVPSVSYQTTLFLSILPKTTFYYLLIHLKSAG